MTDIHDWIFNKTDYLIVGYIKGESGYTTVFARDKEHNTWYGCSTSGNDLWTGVLVTNKDFEPEMIK